MTMRKLTLIVGVIVLVGLLSWVAVAVAQPAGGGQGGGQRPDGGRMMAMMGMMQPPAIAVAGNAVFVVRGNMIYKFDAETLELLAQAEIPAPAPPPAPPAAPGQ